MFQTALHTTCVSKYNTSAVHVGNRRQTCNMCRDRRGTHPLLKRVCVFLIRLNPLTHFQPHNTEQSQSSPPSPRSLCLSPSLPESLLHWVYPALSNFALQICFNQHLFSATNKIHTDKRYQQTVCLESVDTNGAFQEVSLLEPQMCYDILLPNWKETVINKQSCSALRSETRSLIFLIF